MFRAGIIELATAEYVCPVVFYPKNHDTMRFCVDYRNLNTFTVWDSYLIPRMDDCIDSLGDVTAFTMRDCNRGYWHIEIAGEDRDKTVSASQSAFTASSAYHSV